MIFYLHIPDQNARPHTPSWGWRGAPVPVCSRPCRNRDFHRSRGHTSSTSSVSEQKLHNRNISMCVVKNSFLIESVVSFPAGVTLHQGQTTGLEVRLKDLVVFKDLYSFSCSCKTDPAPNFRLLQLQRELKSASLLTNSNYKVGIKCLLWCEISAH